jgi:dolichol-phosphate mannosyltransferase
MIQLLGSSIPNPRNKSSISKGAKFLNIKIKGKMKKHQDLAGKLHTSESNVEPANQDAPSPVRFIVLAYNEGPNLELLCNRIQGVMENLERKYEIFIVNDGSSDNTSEVVDSLKTRLPIRELRHEVNRGVASAFLTGFRAALEDADDEDPLIVMEGDGTSDPAVVPQMLEQLSPPCDIVIASRYAPGGRYVKFPIKRLVLSGGANTLLCRLCPVAGVRDYTIFYRTYRAGPLRQALAEYGDDFTSTEGFACNAEMLLRLEGFIGIVREVPFVYDYGLKKGASSIQISGNLLAYARLFRIFLTRRRKKKISN